MEKFRILTDVYQTVLHGVAFKIELLKTDLKPKIET